MNAPHDLDRQLTAWLEDGPSSAPERTLDFAIGHALAHPRRRDPFAWLRKDPMSSTRSAAVLRPIPFLAILGLLVAAAVAATIGGYFQGRPSVVPPPVTTASPSATAPASAAPSSIPSAAPSATAAVVHVDLIEHVGADASVDIVDLSGSMSGATSGNPGDGGSVPDGTISIAAQPGNVNGLVLTWSGTPCVTTHQLTISADLGTITITRTPCAGASIPVDHVLELTFDHRVDPTTIKTDLSSDHFE